MNFKKVTSLLLSVCLFCLALPVLAQEEEPEWEYNKVITKGGVYTGNYRSIHIPSDPIPKDENTVVSMAAVFVDTDEPVYFIGARFKSMGSCISAYKGNITIINCEFENENPLDSRFGIGRACNLQGVKNLRIENNYFNHTGGVYVLGYNGNQTPEETIKIRYNKYKNIDGRMSNGPDGTLGPGTGYVQAVQFDKVFHLKHAEVAWNEVENEPYESRPEDVMNFYCSSGTESSPLQVHHNFIFGAYPADPVNDGFSGGGIICDGDDRTQYVHIHDNIIVNTTNHGAAIAAGYNNQIYNNYLISSGKLPTGEQIAAANVGIYAYDTIERNHHIYNNTCGWIRHDNVYNSYYVPQGDPVEMSTNIGIPWEEITTENEYRQKDVWKERKKESGIETGILAPYIVRPYFKDDSTAVLQNSSDKPFAGKAYISAYNEGNKQCALLNSEEVSLTSGTQTIHYSLNSLAAGSQEISVFAWDDGMQPYSKKVTQTITIQ